MKPLIELLYSCNCWQPTCKVQYSNHFFIISSSSWQIRFWFASCPARNCDHRLSQCSEVSVPTCMEPFTWVLANCVWAQTWVAYNLIKEEFRIPSYKFTYSCIWIVLSPGTLFVIIPLCIIFEQTDLGSGNQDLSFIEYLLPSCIQEGVEEYYNTIQILREPTN